MKEVNGKNHREWVGRWKYDEFHDDIIYFRKLLKPVIYLFYT